MDTPSPSPEKAVPVRRRTRVRRAVSSNVVPLHQRIMPRHTELLVRWLEAGRPMGLSEATIFAPAPVRAARVVSEYVLIWVRENTDPAYIVRPEGLGWVVIDAVREDELGRTRSFATALHMIRPVLKLIDET